MCSTGDSFDIPDWVATTGPLPSAGSVGNGVATMPCIFKAGIRRELLT